MTSSKRVEAARPWANVVGYSRATRRGQVIEVSGTSATTAEGEVVAPKDAYRQTEYILREIEKSLRELDASLEDVVRTRVFLTDIGKWEEVGRAHGELFHAIAPACTFVEVSALLMPDLVVEIEASAVVM